MPCYHPISAWRSPAGIKFHCIKDSDPIQLPCGRCIGCRLERSRQWAVRLMHESRFHDQFSFITLTYDSDHLPMNGSLDIKHFQDFMKRLRKKLHPRKIRFFHCGEYGDLFGRPHYHAIIFGFDFRDSFGDLSGAYDVATDKLGHTFYRSRLLDSVWPFGMNKVGDVTFETCAYVARYITKKVTGDKDWVDSQGRRRPASREHYQRLCEATGEIFQVAPEYCSMSRRPGIGALHASQYLNEIYLRDEIISRGFPGRPPRFYDKLLARLNRLRYDGIKENREHALMTSSLSERSPERLCDREVVKTAKLGLFSRKYEEQ